MCFTEKQFNTLVEKYPSLLSVLNQIPPLFGDAHVSLCHLAGCKFGYGPNDFNYKTFLEVISSWIYCWPERGDPGDISFKEADLLFSQIKEIVHEDNFPIVEINIRQRI